MASIEITDENFEEKVLKSPKGKFILKMEADWCGAEPLAFISRGFRSRITATMQTINTNI
jgi:hypothetical protein